MEAIRPRREVAEAMAREAYRRRYPEGRPRAQAPANIGPTLQLLGAELRVLPYRGRGYEVGHVSFEDGLRLSRARTAVEALNADTEVTSENAEAYLRAMRLIVRMAPRYLLPIERGRRFLWRLGLRRNPFRRATVAEVGQLLAFFLASEMRSRVRFSAGKGAALAPMS